MVRPFNDRFDQVTCFSDLADGIDNLEKKIVNYAPKIDDSVIAIPEVENEQQEQEEEEEEEEQVNNNNNEKKNGNVVTKVLNKLAKPFEYYSNDKVYSRARWYLGQANIIKHFYPYENNDDVLFHFPEMRSHEGSFIPIHLPGVLLEPCVNYERNEITSAADVTIVFFKNDVMSTYQLINFDKFKALMRPTNHKMDDKELLSHFNTVLLRAVYKSGHVSLIRVIDLGVETPVYIDLDSTFICVSNRVDVEHCCYSVGKFNFRINLPKGVVVRARTTINTKNEFKFSEIKQTVKSYTKSVVNDVSSYFQPFQFDEEVVTLTDKEKEVHSVRSIFVCFCITLLTSTRQCLLELVDCPKSKNFFKFPVNSQRILKIFVPLLLLSIALYYIYKYFDDICSIFGYTTKRSLRKKLGFEDKHVKTIEHINKHVKIVEKSTEQLHSKDTKEQINEQLNLNIKEITVNTVAEEEDKKESYKFDDEIFDVSHKKKRKFKYKGYWYELDDKIYENAYHKQSVMQDLHKQFDVIDQMGYEVDDYTMQSMMAISYLNGTNYARSKNFISEDFYNNAKNYSSYMEDSADKFDVSYGRSKRGYRKHSHELTQQEMESVFNHDSSLVHLFEEKKADTKLHQSLKHRPVQSIDLPKKEQQPYLTLEQIKKIFEKNAKGDTQYSEDFYQRIYLASMSKNTLSTDVPVKVFQKEFCNSESCYCNNCFGASFEQMLPFKINSTIDKYDESEIHLFKKYCEIRNLNQSNIVEFYEKMDKNKKQLIYLLFNAFSKDGFKKVFATKSEAMVLPSANELSSLKSTLFIVKYNKFEVMGFRVVSDGCPLLVTNNLPYHCQTTEKLTQNSIIRLQIARVDTTLEFKFVEFKIFLVIEGKDYWLLKPVEDGFDNKFYQGKGISPPMRLDYSPAVVRNIVTKDINDKNSSIPMMLARSCNYEPVALTDFKFNPVNSQITYNANTKPGDSGSLIFTKTPENKYCVIGIHATGEIEKTKNKFATGFALCAIKNEAAQKVQLKDKNQESQFKTYILEETQKFFGKDLREKYTYCSSTLPREPIVKFYETKNECKEFHFDELVDLTVNYFKKIGIKSHFAKSLVEVIEDSELVKNSPGPGYADLKNRQNSVLLTFDEKEFDASFFIMIKDEVSKKEKLEKKEYRAILNTSPQLLFRMKSKSLNFNKQLAQKGIMLKEEDMRISMQLVFSESVINVSSGRYVYQVDVSRMDRCITPEMITLIYTIRNAFLYQDHCFGDDEIMCVSNFFYKYLDSNGLLRQGRSINGYPSGHANTSEDETILMIAFFLKFFQELGIILYDFKGCGDDAHFVVSSPIDIDYCKKWFLQYGLVLKMWEFIDEKDFDLMGCTINQGRPTWNMERILVDMLYINKNLNDYEIAQTLVTKCQFLYFHQHYETFFFPLVKYMLSQLSLTTTQYDSICVDILNGNKFYLESLEDVATDTGNKMIKSGLLDQVREKLYCFPALLLAAGLPQAANIPFTFKNLTDYASNNGISFFIDDGAFQTNIVVADSPLYKLSIDPQHLHAISLTLIGVLPTTIKNMDVTNFNLQSIEINAKKGYRGGKQIVLETFEKDKVLTHKKKEKSKLSMEQQIKDLQKKVKEQNISEDIGKLIKRSKRMKRKRPMQPMMTLSPIEFQLYKVLLKQIMDPYNCDAIQRYPDGLSRNTGVTKAFTTSSINCVAFGNTQYQCIMHCGTPEVQYYSIVRQIPSLMVFTLADFSDYSSTDSDSRLSDKIESASPNGESLPARFAPFTSIVIPMRTAVASDGQNGSYMINPSNRFDADGNVWNDSSSSNSALYSFAQGAAIPLSCSTNESFQFTLEMFSNWGNTGSVTVTALVSQGNIAMSVSALTLTAPVGTAQWQLTAQWDTAGFTYDGLLGFYIRAVGSSGNVTLRRCIVTYSAGNNPAYVNSPAFYTPNGWLIGQSVNSYTALSGLYNSYRNISSSILMTNVSPQLYQQGTLLAGQMYTQSYPSEALVLGANSFSSFPGAKSFAAEKGTYSAPFKLDTINAKQFRSIDHTWRGVQPYTVVFVQFPYNATTGVATFKTTVCDMFEMLTKNQQVTEVKTQFSSEMVVQNLDNFFRNNRVLNENPLHLGMITNFFSKALGIAKQYAPAIQKAAQISGNPIAVGASKFLDVL